MRTELLGRHDIHLLRKTSHILPGLVGMVFYSYTDLAPKEIGTAILIFAITFLLFDLLRLKVESLNKFMLKAFGSIMRDTEENSITGLPFYASGIALSLILFEEPFAILSILFLLFSDPVSSAVGIMHGEKKIYGNKSLEGTMAGFFCSFAIVLIYGLMYFPVNINLFSFALISAIGCALIELFTTVIDDNFTIPLMSGALMTFLNLFIPMIG